jgi:phytoene synthase
VELIEAYRECERITWTQARNFAYGIRLLPAAKRRGLAVIYAFARRIDDIGDGTLPAEKTIMPAQEKIAALEQARRQLLDLSRPDPGDPVLLALSDVERTFPVPMQAFGELIDGCVADVRGTHYETFEDLLYYCRCVAGSIGRLSLGIFGTSQDMEQASRLADSLGVALQLTNILRDIREDHQNGRVYLPAEDLAKFDCSLDMPDVPQFTKLVDFEAERARDWYATGLGLLPMLDRRSAACTGAMAGIYRRLLDRIAAQPAAVLHGRVSLSGREKAMVAVKALAGRIG